MLARALRPLLALLLAGPLALAGLVAAAGPAAACSCAVLTFKQQVKMADTVFVGKVAGEGTPSGNDLTYDVVASRVFKGELEDPRVQVSSAADSAACGIGPVETGQNWLFLTTEGTTSSCSGSAPASTQVMERAQRLFGIGTRLEPPAPTEAVRTRVESSPPTELSRLAAPGAALVLLGLLGLAVVSRVGRPH
ncbi:hypothetical protein [Nocardioides solisilvae]|uniref:hypothetical protein n=1 Tax=Nocardioides solisilvae TaxID=1542435 RepID=UPI000D74DE67|nr:hypothetical protein [Nocardioides solisilvae]